MRDRILDGVRRRLCAADGPGPPAADPVVVGQVLRQAIGVLEEVGAIDAPPGPGPDAATGTGEGIGAARAGRAGHPSYSLRAAAVLFDVSLPEIAEAWSRAGVPDAHERAARMLHRATLDRIASGTVAYVDTLLTRLHTSHVGERQRVSRELHDRVGHTIAVAMQKLDLHLCAGDRGPAAEAVRAALEEALGDVRRLSGELRREVDADGLPKAVHRLVEDAVPDHWERGVDVVGPVDEVPRALAEEIFLAVREAVRNAVAHGDARFLHVSLVVHRAQFRAEVTDTGRGFEPGAERRTGSGLESMRERVDLLGGTVVVDSAPGRGTSVRLSIPLPGLGL